MDPIQNPFAPGAGTQPPELAGRDEIIGAASIALQRIILGRQAKSQILLGLRGTGKTVLLNKIEELAEHNGHVTSFIEAQDEQSLATLLYPKVYQALRQLSKVDRAKAAVHRATRALRGFASAFKISMGDVSLSVDPEEGVADSGNLEYDLVDLFRQVGEAAKAADGAWTILIDEVHYLEETELAALIVAMHRINQKQLPVLFFGAGLPQIAALSGNAKSYAERLFDYPPVGALEKKFANAAIRQPIENEGESIANNALALLVKTTQGYPFFLQEWGYQAWDIAARSPISLKDVRAASGAALRRLDAGFFKVRLDRLTPKEQEYVRAMAELGTGPYRSADVAERLGELMTSLGPRRATIIGKGMIYSPAHGDIDFTVPMFDEFLRRTRATS